MPHPTIIPRGDNSYTIVAELPDNEAAAVSYIGARVTNPANGTSLITELTDSITIFGDRGGGLVDVTSASALGWANANAIVEITETTHYNGVFYGTGTAGDAFHITDAYNTNDATGTWTEMVSATVPTAMTQSGATVRLANTTTVSTPTYAPKAGELWRVGSTAEGWDTMRVRSYDSSTKIITWEGRLKYAHATSGTIRPRFCSVAVDTSVTAWDNVNEVEIIWFPIGGQPWTELREVAKWRPEFGGLGERFAVRWPRYWEHIPGGEWDRFEADARNNIKRELDARALDVGRVVDSEMLAEITQIEIARMIAYANGDAFQSEREALDRLYGERFAILTKLPIWVDADQDKIMDTDEDSPAKQGGLSRGL